MIIKHQHCSSLLNLDVRYQFNTVTHALELISVKREEVDVSDLISNVIEKQIIKEIKDLEILPKN